MSTEVSAPTTATAPAAATPPAVIGVIVNGKPLPVHQRLNTRGKGEEKNAPMFVAAYAAERPNLNEIIRIAEQVGAAEMATTIDLEIIRPLYTEASKQSRVKAADGTISIDHGLFAAKLKELLAGFASNQSAKSRAQAALDQCEQEIVEFSSILLEAQVNGKALSQADVNKGQQLLAKRAQLQAELNKTKKGAAPAPTTVAATPPPVAAPAPAK